MKIKKNRSNRSIDRPTDKRKNCFHFFQNQSRSKSFNNQKRKKMLFFSSIDDDNDKQHKQNKTRLMLQANRGQIKKNQSTMTITFMDGFSFIHSKPG